MTKYEKRVQELENQGLTTSDAQGVADVEFAQKCAFTLLEACRALTKEVNLSKLNIKKDFSLINAHAYAMKAIRRAEGLDEVSE